MRIYLRDQHLHLQEHLVRLIDTPVAPLHDERIPEETFITPLDPALITIDRSLLFGYRIFPPRILRALTQWQLADREMRVGDTIAQQIQLPPWTAPSLKIIFGVRISEIMQQPERIGFSYGTLEGHVEIGTSSFTFEKENGLWHFKVRVRSVPGNVWTKLVGPVFTMPYRDWCIRQALGHVKEAAARH